ncbi:MAG: PmoA family protein [Planctomycetes bacterium]|nr:PmoA family protein [Planctomycetota bacterium]
MHCSSSRWTFLLACGALLASLASLPADAQEAKVTFKEQEGGLAVMVGNEPFTFLHTGPEWAKPFLSPVHAAGGAIVTRAIGDPMDKDHPHHKGIWFSVDEVNGVKFWAEAGKIVNVKVEAIEGSPAQIKLKNHWLGPDELPIVIETTTISIFPSRLLIYDATFTAAVPTVTFEDTKEGLFGIRVATTMREKVGGIVTNAEGKKGTKDCWGQPSRWVDYTGVVNGKNYGVTIMDHPANFRPSRYHVRDYGLFSVSPFGEGAYQNDKEKAQPVKLEAGKSLRLRYGLYIHAGDAQEGKVSDAYGQFLKATE